MANSVYKSSSTNIDPNSNQTMTVAKYISKIRSAKDVINKKLSEQDLDNTIREKLESMLFKYEATERKINKQYDKVRRKYPGLLVATKSTMTLIELNKLTGKNFNPADPINISKPASYNAIDAIKDTQGFILGVGAVSAGLGAVNAITHAITNLPGIAGTQFAGKGIFGVVFQALKGLGISGGMIGAGLGLVAVAKLVPAISRKVHEMKRHQAYANSVKNDISAEFEENQEFDSNLFNANNLTNENYPQYKERIVQAIVDNPRLNAQLLRMISGGELNVGEVKIAEFGTLNASQQENLVDAWKEAAIRLRPKMPTYGEKEQKGEGKDKKDQENESVDEKGEQGIQGEKDPENESVDEKGEQDIQGEKEQKDESVDEKGEQGIQGEKEQEDERVKEDGVNNEGVKNKYTPGLIEFFKYVAGFKTFINGKVGGAGNTTEGSWNDLLNKVQNNPEWTGLSAKDKDYILTFIELAREKRSSACEEAEKKGKGNTAKKLSGVETIQDMEGLTPDQLRELEIIKE